MPTVLDTLVTRIGPEYFGAGEIRKLESGIARAQAKLNSFAAGFAAAGAAITGTAGLSVRTFFNFEVAQNQLQATLDVTAERMVALREQAKELGRTTEFSAVQATEAQVQLAQAGFSLNEILEATPQVLALASAGQIEMGEAAKLTANQLRAFGLDVSQAGRVTDVLAATAAKANTNVSELGPAFRQVAPIAAAAGLTIEQVAGYLAVLRNNGLAAEQAGTALRAVLGRLVSPSTEVRNALQAIGLDPDFVLNQIEAGNLQAVLQALRTTGLDVSEAMRLFGQEAGAAGIILTSNADAAATLTAELETAAGAAQRMADVQNQGIVGAVRNLRSAWEGLQIAIGEAGLGGAVERLSRLLTRMTNALTEADPWVRKLMAGALAAGPALVGLGAALKGVSFALGGLAPAGAALTWIAKQTGIATAATWLWNASLGFGPKLAAAIGSAMLRAQAIGVAAATALNIAWSRLYLTLKFGGLKGLFLTLWASISSAGVVAFATIKGAALGAFAAIKAAGIGAFAAVKAGALAAWAGLKGLTLAGMWAGIKAGGIAAFGAIKVAAAAVFGGLATIGWPVILAFVAVAATLIAAWKPVSTFFSGLFGGLVDGWHRVGEAGGRLLDALGPVGTGMRSIATGIGDAFGWLWDKLRGGFGWLANIFPEQGAAGRSFADTIINGIVGMIDAITSLIEWWRNLFSLMADVGANIFDTVVSGIVGAKDRLVAAVTDGLSAVRDLLPFSDARVGPLSTLTKSGRAIVTTLAEGVKSAPPLKDALLAGAIAIPPINLPDIILPAPPEPVSVTHEAAAAPQPTPQGVPALPQLSLPALPSLPEFPRLPDIGLRVPTLPSLPALPQFPQLPRLALPQLPALPQFPALPSLPALPRLPSLPQFPDLPQLPQINVPSLDAIAPPLPVGPVPPPATGGNVTVTVELAEGAITVNTTGGDPDEIAERIGGELSNQWRALAEQVDSRVRA